MPLDVMKTRMMNAPPGTYSVSYIIIHCNDSRCKYSNEKQSMLTVDSVYVNMISSKVQTGLNVKYLV